MTCEPAILEQVLSVKIFRTKGFDSPVNNAVNVRRQRYNALRRLPCRVTILAIWITGSWLASGKMPLRPAHSISKLSIRRGAILDHSPSGGCDMNLSHLVLLEYKYRGCTSNRLTLRKFQSDISTSSRGRRCSCLQGPRSNSYRRPWCQS